MERHEKLKLLRGLYCLTQEQMAALANKCHRSVYSTVETAKIDSRRLTVNQAWALSCSLRFDMWWFNGDSDMPLHDYRFSYIDLDWSQRHLAVTTSVRCRRINDAERAVKSYLPQMLRENAPVKCVIGQTDNSGQLFFFIFEQQGLLLRTVPGQQITEIIREVQSGADSEPQVLSMPETDFDGISNLSSKAVLKFVNRCNLDRQSMDLIQPGIEAISSEYFGFMSRFDDDMRQTTLRAICREILQHGFSRDEIDAMLDELRHDDFKPQKSARP